MRPALYYLRSSDSHRAVHSAWPKIARIVGRTSLVCVLLGTTAGCSLAGAQAVSQSHARQIPPCAALTCEDELLLTIALDGLLKASPECMEATPVVLNTLHLAPMGTATLPESPAVLRMDDMIPSPFRRYWPEIRIVDALAVTAGEPQGRGCLLIFSPPLARRSNELRVEIVLVRSQPRERIQRFVVLSYRDGRWVVDRVETGRMS